MEQELAAIGGCDSTACTIADQMFDIPAIGTMAHSWIQLLEMNTKHLKPGQWHILITVHY